MLKQISILILAAASLGPMAAAQSAHRSDEVNGLGSGTVRILPNPRIGETVAVFTADHRLTDTSSQIVFVFMQGDSAYPPAWSGRARVFTGDGFVAFSPQSTAPSLLLKFSDRAVPSRLASLRMQSYSGFGIARYGETIALTDAEIATLAQTGKLPPPAKLTCQSGGPGATTASLGNPADPDSTPPAVSCNPGYYACCSADGRCGCQQ